MNLVQNNIYGIIFYDHPKHVHICSIYYFYKKI